MTGNPLDSPPKLNPDKPCERMKQGNNSACVRAAKPLPQPGRIVSLDVMRGIVIAFMIMANNNGSGIYAYGQLKHSEWNGWTFTDLVFPSFVFMVGVSAVFSAEARLAKGDSRSRLVIHILRRAATLFMLGLIVNAFPRFHLSTLRVYGVLQRIAICYVVVSLIYLLSRRVGTFVFVTMTCLLGYYLLMRWVPVPGLGVPTSDIPFLDPVRNWVAFVDRTILPNRLYQQTRDPEGLLSDIPAIATASMGVLTALWLRGRRARARKAAGLLFGSLAGLFLGLLWSRWFPINKQLWTSSYALFAAGCTLLLMTPCYWLLDVRSLRGSWNTPIRILGANSITAYMVSELLAATLNDIQVPCSGVVVKLQTCIYSAIFQHVITPSFGALLYSVVFLSLCWIPNALLYRRGIFLKI